MSQILGVFIEDGKMLMTHTDHPNSVKVIEAIGAAQRHQIYSVDTVAGLRNGFGQVVLVSLVDRNIRQHFQPVVPQSKEARSLEFWTQAATWTFMIGPRCCVRRCANQLRALFRTVNRRGEIRRSSPFPWGMPPDPAAQERRRRRQRVRREARI